MAGGPARVAPKAWKDGTLAPSPVATTHKRKSAARNQVADTNVTLNPKPPLSNQVADANVTLNPESPNSPRPLQHHKHEGRNNYQQYPLTVPYASEP